MIKEICEKILELTILATPGPWYKDRDFPEVKKSHTEFVVISDSHNPRSQQDCNYIAAVNPQTVALLCAKLIRYEKALQNIQTDFVPENKQEEAIALYAMRDCASEALE